jgi:hypothetical protein
MHDNGRIQTSRVSRAFQAQHNITPINWPAYSPDLNPMKHLWSHLKTRMSKFYPQYNNYNEAEEEWSGFCEAWKECWRSCYDLNNNWQQRACGAGFFVPPNHVTRHPAKTSHPAKGRVSAPSRMPTPSCVLGMSGKQGMAGGYIDSRQCALVAHCVQLRTATAIHCSLQPPAIHRSSNRASKPTRSSNSFILREPTARSSKDDLQQ